MNYSPKQNLKILFPLSLAITLPGAVFFCTAGKAPNQLVFQILGLGLCSLGLFLLYRYGLITYNYIVEDGELTVNKVTGKRINAVARIDLSECELFAKRDRIPQEEQKYSGGRFTYTVNVAPKSEYLLVFTDGEKKTALILECDEVFAAALSALLPDNAQIKL